MRFLITASRGSTSSSGDQAIDDEKFAAYMRYNEELHRAGVLIASEGLNPTRKGARVVASQGKRVVLDGPFAESKELVGGLYIIEVTSLDEAVRWALRCPVGLDAADVLTIHPMTEPSDIPEKYLDIIRQVAPTWSAVFRGKR